MAKKVSLPILVPNTVYRLLKRARQNFARSSSSQVTVDIGGERNIEWSFISSEIPNGPGEALEFGCEQGYMSLVAAQRGLRVIANDLERQSFCWKHPLVEFMAGDFLDLDLPDDHFDIIIDCSSIEHVGVAGRYGISQNDDDGDVRVMRRLVEVLKPGGKLLMTAPCGRDSVLAPWCRVYGSERLPLLFAGLLTERENYWKKNEFNQWIECNRQDALSFQPRNHPTNPHACAYNLGCFVLRKPA